MAYTQQCKAELCRMLPNVPNLEAAADRLFSRMECQVNEEEDRLFDGRRILCREEENDVLVMMVDSLIEKTNGDNGKRNCCFAICKSARHVCKHHRRGLFPPVL